MTLRQTMLQRLGIETLNTMQAEMLKSAQQHQDIILHAPTGAGKTLAFLLPILERLNSSITTTQAIIIVPARELALQIEQVLKEGQSTYISRTLYGGKPLQQELNALSQITHIIVGTPGRIADHIRRGSFDPSTINHLVLDEFDKSLELGFTKEMAFILEHLTSLKSHYLTSATDTVPVPDYVKMKAPFKLDFTREAAGLTENKLQLNGIVCTQDDKTDTLLHLLGEVGHENTLIFCNHRNAVERLSDILYTQGIACDIFHGGLDQKQRELALLKFRNGSCTILVTTDLAARGLDINNLKNIIHFQLPHDEASFIHRNGRTARMDQGGDAYLFLAEDKLWREYIDDQINYIELPIETKMPPAPEWETLYISLGKRDKIRKFDIAGTFYQQGELERDDVGPIDIKEQYSYVAIRRSVVAITLKRLNKQRIKKKKAIIERAR